MSNAVKMPTNEHPISLMLPKMNVNDFTENGNLSSRQNFQVTTNSSRKQMGIKTPNYGGNQDISDKSLKHEILKAEPMPQDPMAMRPSKFRLLEEEYMR